jgi:hypothetical protein
MMAMPTRKMPAAKNILTMLFGWFMKYLQDILNGGYQICFRDGSHNIPCTIVYHGVRHPADIVFICQIGKFHCLDHFCLDELILHGKHVCEHHGSRAVRSGGGNKDLEMDGFFYGL